MALGVDIDNIVSDDIVSDDIVLIMFPYLFTEMSLDNHIHKLEVKKYLEFANELYENLEKVKNNTHMTVFTILDLYKLIDCINTLFSPQLDNKINSNNHQFFRQEVYELVTQYIDTISILFN